MTINDEISVILDAYKANTLGEIAQAAGITITEFGKKMAKDRLLAHLRTELFTKERVLASFNGLTTRERTVLNRLLLHNGVMITRNFRRELVRAGLATEGKEPERPKNYYYSQREVPYADGYIGQPHRRESTVFEDIIARLTLHGLVFSQLPAQTGNTQAYKLQYHPAASLYVPQVVRQYLPEPEPVPSNQADWQPARTYTADPSLFLRDLYLYWDCVRQNEIPLLQNGLVAKRALKTINDALLQPDPAAETAAREDEMGHLYLLRQMLEALQLVKRQSSSLRITAKDTLTLPAFWTKNQAEQVADCLAAWPQLTGLKDVSGGETAKYGAHFAAGRQAVLALLKTITSAIWVEAEEFLEQLRTKNENFLLPSRSGLASQRYYGSSYYNPQTGDYIYGSRAEVLKSFEQMESLFVNACLTGFLYRLGLVELGSRDATAAEGQLTTWQAFRLTPLGQAALLGKPLPETAHPGKVVIQPNFQIMALGPVGLDVLAQFDLFAQRESADRGAFQYRLTRESVYRAQQLGLPVAEVTHILEQFSETELPQNVRRSLEEWASHHERIVFRRGVNLLQAATADLLNRLLAEPPTANLLARPVAADVALVKTKRPEKLIAALLEQGLLPAVSGANPEAADRSVVIAADGLIRPVHAVPSLHLRGRLAQLAEESDDGTWWLTPPSVRRAGGSRNKVNRLLEELDKLQRGPLPEQVVTQVKAWGGYYGGAAAATLTLVEFSDAAALEELRRHPTLQSLLTPFAAGPRALAAVPTERMVEIKEILASFGVSVKDGLGY